MRAFPSCTLVFSSVDFYLYFERCKSKFVPWYLHLDLSKHVMRNISRFRLRAHTLKVKAEAWLEDGSRVCDQCPGEDEHVQNEVHAILLCQDHRVGELRNHFSFLFTPFFKDISTVRPFLLQQVNNFFFFWWGLLHGPQQGPDRMKEKTYKTGKRKTPA